MKLIKEEDLEISDWFSYEGEDYFVEGKINLKLFDDSDYSSYGPYQEVQSDYELKINPFNEAALLAFVEKEESEF